MLFFFVFCSLLLIVLVFCFFSQRLITGGVKQGQTGPMRVTIETRAETEGSTLSTCHFILFVLYSIYFFFSLFFFSIVYSATTDGTGRDATGPARALQQHGMGQGGRRAGKGS